MMSEVEIKHEFNNDRIICCTCLSVGRTLQPVGEYASVLRIIASDYTLQNEEHMEVCWECKAALQKITQFQCRVFKANEMLRLGQSYLYGTLSNLTTIVLNDTHPNTVYVNTLTHTKNEDSKADINDNAEPTDEDNYNEDIKFDSEVKSDLIEEEIKLDVVKRYKSNNKWAKKKALQNKRPKFKIVSCEGMNIEELFRKVTMDQGELYKRIERERDSEYYKSKTFREINERDLGSTEEKSLVKHNERSRHQSLAIYTCDICNVVFRDKRHLSAHIIEHYNKYTCKVCEYTCSSKKQIDAHVKGKHRKLFQCLKCELKFSCRRDFYKHFKEWHERFICDHCGISFKMRYCIKDHIRKQHSPIECKLCRKRFARYNGLWLHNKLCHTAPKPTAYCVECDKGYPDVYRYRWHLANSTKHTPKKKIRIPCPGCDKIFSKNIYMKDHYNLVHLKQYKYRCEECDKNFIRNADLVKHKRRVHEGILPPKNKICYICGRGFSSNKILTNHVRTHTGERPFACGTCGARFAQRSALSGHRRALGHKAVGEI